MSQQYYQNWEYIWAAHALELFPNIGEPKA